MSELSDDVKTSEDDEQLKELEERVSRLEAQVKNLIEKNEEQQDEDKPSGPNLWQIAQQEGRKQRLSKQLGLKPSDIDF